ncbi:MAG: alpha/beta hydrolase [Erysipelotrichales bacterium]|nr:alpha/beta hydrolase [Erysipelotrichales bacterium]
MRIIDSYTSTMHVHVRYYIYQPKVVLRIKGIVQIHHGLGEHAELYDHFASYLLSRGFVVVLSDFVGHGQSLIDFEQGYFGKENGPENIVEDMKHLVEVIRKSYPEEPYFLLGVNMGSIFIQKFISQYGDFVDGILLLGTFSKTRFKMLKHGYLMLAKAIYGPTHKGHHMYKWLYNHWNKGFGNSEVDWFSSDDEEKEKYLEDPMSHFIYPVQGYHDIIKTVSEVNSDELIQTIPQYLSVYIGVGEHDPISRDVKKLVEKYKKHGIRDLTFEVFNDCRNAVLFEKNKKFVYKHILNWLNDRTYL